jgi:hypothetical protein
MRSETVKSPPVNDSPRSPHRGVSHRRLPFRHTQSFVIPLGLSYPRQKSKRKNQESVNHHLFRRTCEEEGPKAGTSRQRTVGVLSQRLEDGQCERRGLATASLRSAQYILARECGRDAVLLYGGGFLDAQLRTVARQPVAQAQLHKRRPVFRVLPCTAKPVLQWVCIKSRFFPLRCGGTCRRGSSLKRDGWGEWWIVPSGFIMSTGRAW